MGRDLEHNFSRNDIIGLMHESTSSELNQIADHIEKYKYDVGKVITLLREIADEHEAQSVVVNLRDEL